MNRLASQKRILDILKLMQQLSTAGLHRRRTGPPSISQDLNHRGSNVCVIVGEIGEALKSEGSNYRTPVL